MALEVSFLFGGISTEYDGSITSLINVISSYLALSDEKRPFAVKHLYHISRNDGLVRTIPFCSVLTIEKLQAYLSDTSTLPGDTLLTTFDSIKSRDEYVVNLLHGQFGEDGGVQTLAALAGLRGTFGDPHVASLTMNKYAMSAFVSSVLPAELVRVPETTLVTPANVADSLEIVKSLRHSIVVKPNSLGSSLFAKLFHEPSNSKTEIEALLHTIFAHDKAALIQEFIPGYEYTCGCIIGSRMITTLPIVKLEADMQFCGRDQKYSSRIAKKKVISDNSDIFFRLQSIAQKIASSLDFYNMVRFDFRVCKESNIWFLECNYIPGLAEGSSFEKMLHRHGMTVIDLIARVMADSNPYRKPGHYIEYERVNES
ncbi:D-alanine--D-alanine ligase [Rhizobium sp. WYCCWR 11146]|uniref:D-alanine--D-alanine ligase family protein n=1 Tax=Rhizobium sp. WYCCWR 11146 TaxID=2749833 RepID=UPI0015E70230|nr:D-alanine--D-alanine ligase [Rhizobium sp. WYCCWR 11146]MBA1346130.1 D-alanine--D-alanine ligase [Rhizobium sp. WYCCWR 11146]